MIVRVIVVSDRDTPWCLIQNLSVMKLRRLGKAGLGCSDVVAVILIIIFSNNFQNKILISCLNSKIEHSSEFV